VSNLALVFSDLQAGEGSDSERLRANPAIPLQRWRVEQFYADLKTLYDRHGCKYLIDLGDTTDDRKSLPVPTIGAIMSGLNAIRPDPKLLSGGQLSSRFDLPGIPPCCARGRGDIRR